MTFAEKLLQLRKRDGLSQEELAERLEVSRQAISRWEMGTVMPDAVNLLKISNLFGVSADYLLREEILQEKDIPVVKRTEDSLMKEHSRRMALFVMIIGQALGFFLCVVSYLVLKSFAMILFAMLMQMMNIIGFEIGFRKHPGITEEKVLWFHRKYYQISVWFFAYFPIRLVVASFFLVGVGTTAVIIGESMTLVAYLAVCLLTCFLMKEPRSESVQ